MKLILLSLGLLFVGMAVVYLMVIQLLKPSFVLSFLAYGISLSGLVLGISEVVGSFRWRGRGNRTFEVGEIEIEGANGKDKIS